MRCFCAGAAERRVALHRIRRKLADLANAGENLLPIFVPIKHSHLILNGFGCCRYVLLALPTLEGWIVRHASEILEPDRNAVHKGDARERSLVRGLEDHARSRLAVDDVIDTVFDGAEELLDLSCRHA